MAGILDVVYSVLVLLVGLAGVGYVVFATGDDRSRLGSDTSEWIGGALVAAFLIALVASMLV